MAFSVLIIGGHRISYIFICSIFLILGLPWWLSGKDSACECRDIREMGSIRGLGIFPGEGNGNPLQCSYLGNPIEGRAWWATVHGVTKGLTQLSDWTTVVPNGDTAPVSLNTLLVYFLLKSEFPWNVH